MYYWLMRLIAFAVLLSQPFLVSCFTPHGDGRVQDLPIRLQSGYG